MSNAEIFHCDVKIFSVISVSLNNKGKYFRYLRLSWIITVISFVNIFQSGFRVFSVTKIFCMIFSVVIS